MRGMEQGSSMRLCYHWTDELPDILAAGRWEAGSVTTNPAYEFSKANGFAYNVCLIFDADQLTLREAPQTVPWPEWEKLVDQNVDLFEYPGAFVAFGGRTVRDLAYIRREVTRVYGDHGLFETRIVTHRKIVTKRYNRTVRA